MNTYEIQKYADSNWGAYAQPFTEISKNNHTNIPLVNDDTIAYNFDSICKSMFSEDKAPASADGLSIHSHYIELVEFKTGFKQRITKDNFDTQKGACEKTGKVCDLYWELFFDNQKRKIKELVASIRLKAIESYITLEKQLFPLFTDDVNPIKIHLTIVIDEDGIDEMEDTLAELSGSVAKGKNIYQDIRCSLSRLNKMTDAEGKSYYYDNIDIISFKDFEKHQKSH